MKETFLDPLLPPSLLAVPRQTRRETLPILLSTNRFGTMIGVEYDEKSLLVPGAIQVSSRTLRWLDAVSKDLSIIPMLRFDFFEPRQHGYDFSIRLSRSKNRVQATHVNCSFCYSSLSCFDAYGCSAVYARYPEHLRRDMCFTNLNMLLSHLSLSPSVRLRLKTAEYYHDLPLGQINACLIDMCGTNHHDFSFAMLDELSTFVREWIAGRIGKTRAGIDLPLESAPIHAIKLAHQKTHCYQAPDEYFWWKWCQKSLKIVI